MVTGIGLYVLYLLGAFIIAGHGVTTAYGRVPIYDGPTLDTAVFVTLVALGELLYGKKRPLGRKQTIYAGVICATLLLLSLRRTYLAEAILGAALLIWVFRERLLFSRRAIVIIVIAVSFFAAIFFGGGTLAVARFKSFDVFATNNTTASTNGDHLADVRDAWIVAKQNPVLGVGIGSSYDSPDTADFKVRSYGVHNALLDVWIHYGILGLIAYLLWNIRLFRILRRLGRHDLHVNKLGVLGPPLFGYSVAVFLVGVFFSPWPYGSYQVGALLAFVYAYCLVQWKEAVR